MAYLGGEGTWVDAGYLARVEHEDPRALQELTAQLETTVHKEIQEWMELKE